MVTDNVEDIGQLHSKTLREFVLTVFEMNAKSASKSVVGSRSVLQEIGVQRYAIRSFNLRNF